MLISRRREAKRRALLQMLDRLPVRTERGQTVKPTATPVAEAGLRRPALGTAPRIIQK